MASIGVDLAWGTRARTGLCAVDDNGDVVASASLVSDADITAWVAAHATTGPVVVGIDAPLVVRNAAGCRPCDRAVTVRFGSRHAGAYPANLGLASFRSGVRGARLAGALGLDLDPASASGRRAIEVYPHAALVALFDLPRSLKYKAKRGRSVEDRRAAFGQLVGAIAAMAGLDPVLRAEASPRWPALVEAVTSEATHAGLNRAEDELDAYVCAYVARLWAQRQDSCVLLGDAESGAVVTPDWVVANGGAGG